MRATICAHGAMACRSCNSVNGAIRPRVAHDWGAIHTVEGHGFWTKVHGAPETQNRCTVNQVLAMCPWCKLVVMLNTHENDAICCHHAQLAGAYDDSDGAQCLAPTFFRRGNVARQHF